MHHARGVRHKRTQTPRSPTIFGVNRLDRNRLATKGFDESIRLANPHAKPRLKILNIYKISHSQAGASDFVTVSRANAAESGADFVLALQPLSTSINLMMIRHDHMCLIADMQASLHVHFASPKTIKLTYQTHRINHHTITDDTLLAPAQDSRRNKVQNVFLTPYPYRVPCIATTLTPHHEIGCLGEHINDLAFAFIAPLGAN